MDRNRTVAGLDVHKDSIYLCIMQQGGAIIFEKIYGTLTPELRQMCETMLAAATCSFSDTDITVIGQYWELIAIYDRQSKECQRLPWGLFDNRETLTQTLVLSPNEWSGEVGSDFNISVSLRPETGLALDVMWSSSDESVATVDSDGHVTVLKEGSCVITATATDGSGIFAECIVTGLAGIEEIFSDVDVLDIYDLNVIRIKKDGCIDDLKQLAPGIYIIRIGDTMKKIVIR